jgi:uncharacterized protein (TIGR00297 family)
MQILLGAALAGLAAALAYRLDMLSRSGAFAAAGLGTVVFGLGGWEWAVVLIVFFVSSSALTRLLGASKRDLNSAFSKGGRRDAGQVLANGGAAGLMVLAQAVWPHVDWPWAAFCGALAAANADTWATELGVLSKTAPRLITTFRPVARGTSGGVTPAGTLASLSGSLLIALCGVVLRPSLVADVGWQPIRFAAAVTLGGLAGSLVDSLLGAALQAIYYCPSCQKETERHPWHTCGAATQRLRGVAWLDNDGVNEICTLVGALAGAAIYFF